MKKKTKPETKIVKRYVFTSEETADGKHRCWGECEGYNGNEVLGILSYKLLDVFEQLAGRVKPDVIKRTVIK